jgi:hypothetical protein
MTTTPSTPQMLDLDAIAATSMVRTPFDYVVVSQALRPGALARIQHDFPAIRHPGIFPLSVLKAGPAFRDLIADIQGPALRDLLAERFSLNLKDMPQMITIRGHCQGKDGRIHRDSVWKELTVLLYLNDEWDAGGGRLRFLRGPDRMDDVIAEVPPNGGTMVAFRVCAESWHGHESFVGPRRYVMFNWVTDQAAAARELARHRFSARLKQLFPFARPSLSLFRSRGDY